MKMIPLWGNGQKNIPNSAVIVQYAVCDDEDYDFLMQQKWYYREKKNPGRHGTSIDVTADIKPDGPKRMQMHRYLMGTPDDLVCDHVDGNRLNNRRENLRNCTLHQNTANRHDRTGASPYKGVSWSKTAKKWRVAIRVHGEKIHLSYSMDQEFLAALYDRAALYYFGDFANLNFPDKIEEYKANPYTPPALGTRSSSTKGRKREVLVSPI